MLRRQVACLLVGLGLMTFVLAGAGCVSGTSRYYMPLVAERFSPKSDRVRIPILEQPPTRSFLVIGKFAFESTDDLNFIYKSLQYNARKNGADAIIVQSLTSRRVQWIETVGPWVGTSRDLDWATQCDGSWGLDWVDRPVFHPGYTVPREETRRAVQAEMIVFK